MVEIFDLIGSAREIQRDGTWFRDSKNRYALFRGINLASRSKLPPYLPILPLEITTLEGIKPKFDQEIKNLEKYFDAMRELGFNVVRLLVMWKAIEPEPNPNPEVLSEKGIKYLELLNEIINQLYKRGIYVIIDFHQDIANDLFGGDGFPDWALGLTELQKQFISGLIRKDQFWMLQYQINLSVRKVLRCFWRQEQVNYNGRYYIPFAHLVKTIGATARFFQSMNNGKGHPAIIGYELFNEPYPIEIDEKWFEEKELAEYYREAIQEIRSSTATQAGDTKSFIFMEPRMSWTPYVDMEHNFGDLDSLTDWGWHLDLPSITNDKRIVFAFHYYDFGLFIPGIHDMQKNKDRWKSMFRKLYDEAAKRGGIPFLTEFGASNNWQESSNFESSLYKTVQRAAMDLQYQQVESCFLNSTYWNYDFYNKEDTGDNWNFEDFSILGSNRKLRNEDIVARPYPMRSSAEPSQLKFDLKTKHGIMIFKGLPVEAPTIIYVPQIIHYKNGFEAHATNDKMEWYEREQILLWWPSKSDVKHQMIICPSDSFDERVLPKESKELLPITKVLSIRS